MSVPSTVAALLRRLTTRSSSNFKFAFLFLGRDQRDALSHVYEFCRVVDDIVDEREPGEAGVQAAKDALREWSTEIARIYADPYVENVPPQTDLGKALAHSRTRFNFPREAFDEIIAGVAMDLHTDRYADLEALRLYCYRVASCVGFLCLPIFGDQSKEAHEYGEHLGLALQYTNILRDIAEDAERGRVYIPQSLLERHGLTDQDLIEGRYDGRFVAMAKDFGDAAEREYRRAWEALRGANARALLPAEIMGRTYYEILVEIRQRNYNVFTRRTSLRRRDKLKVAAKAIARSSLAVVA